MEHIGIMLILGWIRNWKVIYIDTFLKVSIINNSLSQTHGHKIHNKPQTKIINNGIIKEQNTSSHRIKLKKIDTLEQVRVADKEEL